MFFTSDRRDFFRPLTSKYREQIAQCLRLLYQRLYSAQADYGHTLSKDQVLEVFDEALQRAPVLDDENEEAPQRFKSRREQSLWTLKQLLESGWLIKQVDSATMSSTYPFSRMGRLFTQPLVEADSNQIRTRHRNTRNTLNALEAFIGRGEVYDLLDAYEYSERIVTDFTDVIAELDERKRQLVQEIEAQQLVQQATDQFFEFMEKRFQPDVSVRLSADSVEKHRDSIDKAIAKIRRKPKEFKVEAERKLRQQVPSLIDGDSSVLWHILDTIEKRMNNAAEIMLPALRAALHSFTKRADIIIRQLSYLGVQEGDDIVSVCHGLRNLPSEQQDECLTSASQNMAGMRLQWVDPGQIKLHEKKTRRWVNTAVSEIADFDEDARREQVIQQFLDQAFVMDNKGLRQYVQDALNKTNQISTADMPVNNATDLLAMAHAIEVGAVNNLSTEFEFVVSWQERQIETEFYHQVDDFKIELKDKHV